MIPTASLRRLFRRLRSEPPSGALDLLYQPGLDGLDRDPLAADAAVGRANADALDVGPEDTLGLLGHVRADAATLFGLAFTVDDAADFRPLAGY